MSLPDKHPKVAYFCAEFGIDTNLPTYAGGLGVLAGDTLLEAAEQNFPMTGLGLLYQGKYFLQKFSPQGWQIEHPSPFQQENTRLVRPVEIKGKRLVLTLNFFDQDIKFIAYQQRLGGQTSLYFLTTDIDGNPDNWRDIMAAEYTGGDEVQLMQQFLLGIGGIRLLHELKIQPDIFHFQEGRPIFAHWELTNNLMQSANLDFKNASEQVVQKIVYTNHTLVPDGNLIYDANLVKKYADSYAQKNSLNSQELIKPGLTENGGFSITQYGLKTSLKASAVSKLHGELSQKNWPHYNWSVITNGIHLPRWQSHDFKNSNLSDSDLWEIHNSKKRDLQRVVLKRSGFSYDPNRLVLGWARRISAYKQVQTIFGDASRLAKILHNPKHPVQILVAGKAHPQDNSGKKCIQDVMKVMTENLTDHALFIPNYDIALANSLTTGVDLWLNTPELGKEACGTSGMKAIANGVLNCTIPDGWAAEVNWDGLGWVLDHANMPSSLYELLENEIVPMYYDRAENGIPTKWINSMRKSIALSHNFSTERMLQEYTQKLYS